MFEEEYRKEMEAVGPDREQMERLLAAMEQKGRRPRPLRRTILLVAAACAAMVMTVVASAPTLRDTLEEFLGGFAPYAQPVEAAACTANGIEIKVISAMADRAMVKVYAQARDVTGQNRLRADMDVWGGVERPEEDGKGEQEGNSRTMGGKCVGFDPESGTALLEFGTWGTYFGAAADGGLEGMELLVLGIYPDGLGRGKIGEDHWRIPLDIEILSSREVALSDMIGTVRLRTLYLSPLGPSILFEQEAESLLQYSPLAVYLSDGTVLFPRWEGGGGFGLKDDHWTIDPRGLDCWTFEEPVDPEDVTGISLAYWYLPLCGDAAGEGRWLSELPRQTEPGSQTP